MKTNLRIRTFGRRAQRISAFRTAMVWMLPVVLASLPNSALAQVSPARDLADLSIEELMNETVTSASKHEQRLSDVASAISVLTNDDLRRCGATNVWDALRVVPGVQVASVFSPTPAVSVRGFNGIYANKLLVLVDGRPVYSGYYGGVYWYLQQPMFEDLDRIEVIRGPGATIWGANAVNGVINIEGKSARDTQGGLLYFGGGGPHEFMSGIRYGGTLDTKTFYRVYYSRADEDGYPNSVSGGWDASWSNWQAGARVDRYIDEATQFTWISGLTKVRADGSVDSSNVNMLGRWTRSFGSGSSFQAQTYYNRDHVFEPANQEVATDTFDVSFNLTWEIDRRNTLTWGGGARWMRDRSAETADWVDILVDRYSRSVWNAFVQDQLALIPDRLEVTAGIKLEHDTLAKWDIQPTLRALYKSSRQHTFWAAVSRAVRSPSDAEGYPLTMVTSGAPVVGPDGGLYLPRAMGSEGTRAEVLWAYELGYRYIPSHNVSFDAATFYNRYSQLISPDGFAFYPGQPYGTVVISGGNTLGATTTGGEVTAAFDLASNWRISGSYSYLSTTREKSPEATASLLDALNPEHQLVLRSSWDLPENVKLDCQLRYVSAVDALPSYLTGDFNITIRPTPEVEVSLVGQNLFQGRHQEYPPSSLFSPSRVPRGFYARMTWKF